jgi:ABC-2 type transport system permease protein
MNVRRIATLFTKEIKHGPKGVLFLFVVVMPLVLSLLVSLVFGSLFAGKPRLGVVDAGNSQLAQRLLAEEYLVGRRYATPDELRQATLDGVVDVGMILPAGFDQQVRQGEAAEVSFYIWGQSLVTHRLVLASALSDGMVELAGRETPVTIVPETLGDDTSREWSERLLPLLVLMAVIMGGVMIPAVSVIDEKEKRTLTALITTPTSLLEVLLAKGVLGMLLSLVMGFAILLMNRALGQGWGLLLLTLSLGALLAVLLGLLLGLLLKDMNSLLATMKAGGLLLYAPAIIQLFPGMPQWLARLFPTYYMINPVMAITQRGEGWTAVAPDLFIVATFALLMLAALVLLTRRAPALAFS